MPKTMKRKMRIKMKTTLFAIALLLMLNVQSKEKEGAGPTASMLRTSFKVDKIAVNIPLPGADYFCVSEAIMKKNIWCAPKPDMLVAWYNAIGGYSFHKARAKTGITYEEMYPATTAYVKAFKDDIKKECSLDDFKQIYVAAVGDAQAIQPWMVNKLLYEDGKRKDIKHGKTADLGFFLLRDTAFGTLTIAPGGNGHEITCEVTILVKGKVLHMVTKGDFKEASSVKYMMAFTYNWVDATIKANK